MKKLCILLALALLAACVPALAAQGDMILARSQEATIYFNRMFADGDVLYLVSGGDLYRWQPGDEDLTPCVYNLDDDQKNGFNEQLVPFICDGQIYALAPQMAYGEHASYEGTKLYALMPDGEDAFRFEEAGDMDLEELVEYYDEDSYFPQLNGVFGAAGQAYLVHYDDQYNTVVSALDLKKGRLEEMDELRDAYCVTPYRDGMLLVEQYSYSNSSEARLIAFDPEDESTQMLATLEIESYNPLNGLAYDAQTDTVYCVKGGEICPVDLQTGQVGAGVTEMPLESYGSSSACVLEGGYYVYAADGVAIRNLDPGQKPEIRLKIVDTGYTTAINDAYTRFSNQHGEVSLVLSRDYNEVTNLVEDMMNRESGVDIYTLYTSAAAYDAVFKRGYMMELDGSEAVAQLAERMYPSLREALSANGHLVAIPVEVYGSTFSVNEKALEALGMTLADVPDNWDGFLDFLPTLEGPLAENSSVTLSFNGMNERDVRNNFFYMIFNSYQNYVNTVDPNMGYNTELLTGLLRKLEQIDFVALGCPEAEDEDDRAGSISYGSGEQLMLFSMGTGIAIGGGYSSDDTPVLMGLDADTRAPMVLSMSVAFVNPFTRYPEQAMAFVEQLCQSLPTPLLYNLDPSLNEPVRGAQNEQYLQEAREALEKARQDLESAEPAQKQMLEEMVQASQESVDYMEENAWDASARQIEWYRAHAQDVVPEPVNWLYSDESGEAWQLMGQYQEGAISVEDMLKGIDRKMQMRLLEGN
ncbi:MAG: extracellular solute-binding protein [Clostridia bacterium]|nr:extracellular solute-binding protein [Clostridia bacterium]